MTNDAEKPDAISAGNAQPTEQPEARSVDPRVLELLICPLTKMSLEYRSESNELISRSARLAYRIVDGIPLMTEEAARTLDDDELR